MLMMWYDIVLYHIKYDTDIISYELAVGGFKYVLFSPRKLGKIPILTNIFQRGWNHQLDYHAIFVFWGGAAVKVTRKFFITSRANNQNPIGLGPDSLQIQ